MANQSVASENLTSLGIQSFVRSRHVYRTSQLRSSLLTYVKIMSLTYHVEWLYNSYCCIYSLALVSVMSAI